jgi:hypothetical protein
MASAPACGLEAAHVAQRVEQEVRLDLRLQQGQLLLGLDLALLHLGQVGRMGVRVGPQGALVDVGDDGQEDRRQSPVHRVGEQPKDRRQVREAVRVVGIEQERQPAGGGEEQRAQHGQPQRQCRRQRFVEQRVDEQQPGGQHRQLGQVFKPCEGDLGRAEEIEEGGTDERAERQQQRGGRGDCDAAAVERAQHADRVTLLAGRQRKPEVAEHRGSLDAQAWHCAPRGPWRASAATNPAGGAMDAAWDGWMPAGGLRRGTGDGLRVSQRVGIGYGGPSVPACRRPAGLPSQDFQMLGPTP